MQLRSKGLAQARSLSQVFQWISQELARDHGIQTPFWIKTTLSTYIPQWVYAQESNDESLSQDCFQGICSKLSQLLGMHGIQNPESRAEQYTRKLLEKFQEIYQDQ